MKAKRVAYLLGPAAAGIGCFGINFLIAYIIKTHQYLYNLYLNTSFYYILLIITSIFSGLLPFAVYYFIINKIYPVEPVKPAVKENNIPYIFMGFSLCIIFNYITSIIVVAFQNAGHELSNAEVNVVGGLPGKFLYLLSVVIVAPVCEELAIRKFTMSPLMAANGKLAIIWSALIFGLIHGNATQFIFAFMSGIILGYIYYKTKSILFSIIVHALNNASSFTLAFIGDTQIKAKVYMALLVFSLISFGVSYYIISSHEKSAQLN